MVEQKEVLIRLQSVCDTIRKLYHNREERLDDIRRNEGSVKGKKEILVQEENNLKSSQVSIDRKELDLKALEAEINRYKSQLNQIKNNKEYKALKEEISLKEADKSVLEDEILEMMNKLEEKRDISKGLKETVKKEEEELERFTKLVAVDIQRVDAEISEIERRKISLLESLNINARYHFERLIKNKNGIAVARVLNQVCQSCNYEVSPQTINRLLAQKELVFCNSCGRILYLNEEDYAYQK